ncbi:MAG: energy transducer TonB [Hyphomicrobiales bacterium]|nr:energy transducer TonB [Hyphomicrobiales bacterium]MBV8824935.1 energy transducer TonB [Hyphomicrobiales bacterium]MBV9429610.1 energy transducer TonB [Bradyrhizobiaceae bacterium]
MASFGSQPFFTRPELVRWSICAAVVIAAHGLVALAVTGRSDEEVADAGAPVVTLELAPVATAPPAPTRDLAPGPLMESESQQQVAEEAPPDEAKQAKQEKVVAEPPAPDPEVAMAKPETMAEEGPIDDRPAPVAAPAAPVPTAPQAVPTPGPRVAALAVGQVPRPTSAAVATWQRLLVVQLERHKRYPPRAKGHVGEARLAFSIDRGGHVLTSRIVHSSGSEALDDEALAMIKRAAPLPPPPAGISEDQLSFVVPVRYH